jgi:hypothetical protein
VDEARSTLADEYADDVEAHGIEVRVLLGQVSLCERADGGLLASGDRVERATEARSPAQFHLGKDDGLGSEVQIGFRALLTEGATERLELMRAW